jgi:ribosomal protein S18 acetylase RimI-like enzyme
MNDDAVLNYLAWDSDFFGIRIARSADGQLTPAGMATLDEACRRQKIDCLYLLVDAAETGTIRLAEDSGFRLVDVRVTLDRKLSPEKSSWQPAAPGIRLAAITDIAALRPIAAVNHRDSRFYHDGNFPQKRCDELYATWIEKSCTGYADAVLVADRGEGAIGYTSCHVKENGVGSIGLVGISDTCQGQGFGTRLIAEAVSWFKAAGVANIEVVTQGRNIAAQRLYQKNGFLTCSLQLWYHKWFHGTTTE